MQGTEAASRMIADEPAPARTFLPPDSAGLGAQSLAAPAAGNAAPADGEVVGNQQAFSRERMLTG
jgi:hypothetical protein